MKSVLIQDIEAIHPKALESELLTALRDVYEELYVLGSKNCRETECIACGASELTLYCVKFGFEISECPSCGFRFTNPVPSSDQLERLYNSPAAAIERAIFDSTAEARTRIFQQRANLIGEYSSSGKLLDIGSSTGLFVGLVGRIIPDLALSVVELSKDACQLIKSRHPNVTVHNQNFMDHMECYDIVTIWDCIEHIPYPDKVFRKLQEVCAPRGYVFVSTPNTRSLEQLTSGAAHPQVTPLSHVNYFTIPTITTLFERNGFEVVDAQTPNGTFDVAYVRRLLSEDGNGRSALGSFLANAISDDAFTNGLAQLVRETRFAGNMVIVARRIDTDVGAFERN